MRHLSISSSHLFTMHILRSRYICALHLSLIIWTRLIRQTSVLAFQLQSQPQQYSAAAAWQALPQANQQAYAKKCHDNNIKILVSVGGGSAKPVSGNPEWDAVATAHNAAKFAQDTCLDGVDLDWEVCFPHRAPNVFLMHWERLV
jgi:GH18 family chitinase